MKNSTSQRNQLIHKNNCTWVDASLHIILINTIKTDKQFHFEITSQHQKLGPGMEFPPSLPPNYELLSTDSALKSCLLLHLLIFALTRDFVTSVCTVLAKFPTAMTIKRIPQVTTCHKSIIINYRNTLWIIKAKASYEYSSIRLISIQKRKPK